MEEISGIDDMRWILDMLIALGLFYGFYPYYFPIIEKLFNIEKYDNSRWIAISFAFIIISTFLTILSHEFITNIFI